jgi:Fe-S cluster assembly protein SufD
MQDGLFLKVKQDAVISDPVQLLFISTKKSALFINAHNLLVVEKGAKVTFFEKHVSFEENNGFANFFTSINAAESTEVNYFKLQPRGINAKHVANLQISPEKQSKIKCSYILDGSLFSEDHIFIKLHHENVACDLTGLYVVKESEHLKLALRIEHDASNCVSKTLFKGVIDDDASADFSGRVFVAKDTIKNEAHLTDKNLLLSDSAKIKTSPELEIYADDVNCSHGATVGQLDEQMLFYLQSRGIEKAVAQEMLIAAFIDEITESWKPFIII